MKERLWKYAAVLLAVCLTGCLFEAGGGDLTHKMTEHIAETLLEETSIGSVETEVATEAAERDAAEDESAYVSKSSEIQIPEIVVTYGDTKQEIPSAAGGYTLVRESKERSKDNGEPLTETVIACGEDPMNVVFEYGLEVPYLELGEEFSIKFDCGIE